MASEAPNKAWQRALTTLSALALFATIITALYWARTVFIPVTMAIFLAFILSPLVLWLRRLGLGKAPTVILAVALAGVVVLGVIGVVTWQLTELTMTLPEQVGTIKAKLESAKQVLGTGGDNRYEKMFDELAGTIAPVAKPDDGKTVVVESKNNPWLSRAPEYLSPAAEVFGQAAFSLVLAIFILWKRDDIRNRFIRLIGDTRLTTATKAVDDASRRISRYLLMQLLINSVFGVLIAAAMFFIGVKYALLWGVVASLMRYIPYLGTWLGLLPAVLVTIAFTDGWWQPLTVIAVYGVLELICNNILEPKLYGKSMGLSEVAQLIAAAFWAFLWGPIGLILSGPLTVVLLVLGKYVSGLHFFEILLGDEPVLGLDVRFYQRLTARDQDEAWDLIRDELKTRPRTDVFDSIIIPALSFAKRDSEQNDLATEDLARMLLMVDEIVDDAAEPGAKIAAQTPGEVPQTEKVRVLVIPAKDASDEIAGNMLSSLMDDKIWEVDVSPVAQLTSEVMQRAETFQPAVIVICTLPPGGLAHTRYVCKRIAKQFPKARIVVGRCGASADAPEAASLLTEAGASHIANNLADTVHHLNTWSAVLDTQQKVAVKVKEAKTIGTTTAQVITV